MRVILSPTVFFSLVDLTFFSCLSVGTGGVGLRSAFGVSWLSAQKNELTEEATGASSFAPRCPDASLTRLNVLLVPLRPVKALRCPVCGWWVWTSGVSLLSVSVY